MDAVGIAEKIAGYSLKEPNTDKALRFVLSYSEAVGLLYGLSVEDILIEVSELDRRLLNGSYRESINIDTDKFNSNGTVYITKSKAMEFKKEGCKAVLLVYNKGL